MICDRRLGAATGDAPDSEVLGVSLRDRSSAAPPSVGTALASSVDSAVVPTEVADLLADYLDDLARSAHRQIGAVAGVAVTMATELDGPLTPGASTRLARDVDAYQFSVGQGPCLTALAGGGGAYVPDLASATLWGEYGPGAAERGARSCFSVPVIIDDTVYAVFKIYAAEVDGIDERQRQIGVRFASEVVGGIALAKTLRATNAELSDRTDAMASRRTIDLALGMLMERTSCGPDEAFALLRAFSQQRNVKVRDAAAQLVAGGSRAGTSPLEGVAQAVQAAHFQPRGAVPTI